MTAVCFHFLKRSVIIGLDTEQKLRESVRWWETNGLTVSRYVQNINREKGQRSSLAVQLDLKGWKKKHVMGEQKDQIKVQVYTSKI